MNKYKATPRPWSKEVLGGELRVIDENGDDVFLLGECTLDKNQKIADVVIKAVNCHDELVEALKDAKCYMEGKKMSVTEQQFFNNIVRALNKTVAEGLWSA